MNTARGPSAAAIPSASDSGATPCAIPSPCLLGNLLCAVAGLLDNPGGLAALLNQILAILAGL